MMNTRINLPALTIVAAAVAVVTAGCGQASQEAPGAEAAAVVVTAEMAVAELTEVPVVTTASGATEAWRRSSPGTKIMGRVSELLVREGARVSADQVIARLESADLEAALAQARAAMVMAEATLENAETHHERMKQLHAQRSVTDKNLEDATAAYRVAAASLEVMQANIRAAEVAVSYATVRTPIAGWVTTKLVEAGDMAAPGQPLVIVEDLSRVKLKVDVAESVVAGLARGQVAEVTVMGRTMPAAIERIVQAGDASTHTFTVEMVLDNPDGAVREGMFVRAVFGTGTRGALVIPVSAVVERGQLVGVFAVGEGDRAGLRWIKLGARMEDHVEVLSGLQPGERYLVAPPADVHDGARVEQAR